MEGPFPGREGQVLRRRGGLLHLLPRAKAAAAIRTEPRRNSEAFEPGSWSNVPAGPPGAWLVGLFAALSTRRHRQLVPESPILYDFPNTTGQAWKDLSQTEKPQGQGGVLVVQQLTALAS